MIHQLPSWAGLAFIASITLGCFVVALLESADPQTVSISQNRER